MKKVQKLVSRTRKLRKQLQVRLISFRDYYCDRWSRAEKRDLAYTYLHSALDTYYRFSDVDPIDI